ncbi:MAG: hypothetical protein ACT6SC_08750, partial [Blastomonas fulva]
MTLPLISALMLVAAAQTAPGEGVGPPSGQPAQPEQPAQPVVAGQSGEAPAQPAGTAAPTFVAPLNDEARFEACMDMATEDPASGIVAANEWLIGGGGYFARHCLG